MNRKPEAPVQSDRQEEIICRSCGANFSPELANCPYCGTMYLPAAEKAYMHKLEGIRSDLEDLGGRPSETMKSVFRRLRKRLLIPAILLILAILAGFAAGEIKERREAAKDKAETLWQLEYFPLMDAAYDAGDYEKLDALYEDAMSADHRLWNYKHYHFCDFYQIILGAEKALQSYGEGSCDAAYLLYRELQLYWLENLADSIPSDEYARLEALRAPILDDLIERFAPTEEELSAFKKSIRQDGFVPYETCEQFTESRGL